MAEHRCFRSAICASISRPPTSVQAVKGISFESKGETLALVGEPGPEIRHRALSILQLLALSVARHPAGSITLRRGNLAQRADPRLRAHPGNDIAMIFQEPMTSLNPLHTIEKQRQRGLFVHKGLFPAHSPAPRNPPKLLKACRPVGCRKSASNANPQ